MMEGQVWWLEEGVGLMVQLVVVMTLEPRQRLQQLRVQMHYSFALDEYCPH